MSKISKTYTWNWMDENGSYCGWNWCNAFSKDEARKEARANQSPARDDQWGRNKGMYFNEKSIKRVSQKEFMETWSASYQD